MKKLVWMFGVLMGLATAQLVCGTALAGKDSNRGFGDEHPIPWACVNFEGQWKADNGRAVNISQRKCSWLKMTLGVGYEDSSIIIVPDDKVRNFVDNENDVKGSARYRWNSEKYGSVLETYRELFFGNRHIMEFVTLEQVNENLLLESTYRVITVGDSDRPRTETKQVVLRRRK